MNSVFINADGILLKINGVNDENQNILRRQLKVVKVDMHTVEMISEWLDVPEVVKPITALHLSASHGYFEMDINLLEKGELTIPMRRAEL